MNIINININQVNLLLNINCMGCAQSNQVIDFGPSSEAQSPVGVLRVTLTNCLITKYQSMMSTMDPYIVIKLGNQIFQTLPKSNLNKGQEIVFNETFMFVINRATPFYGRLLQIELWDKFKVGKNQIGFGILDLGSVVKMKEQNQLNSTTPTSQIPPELTYKCWLNHDQVSCGYINLVGSFQQLPYEILNFRFESAIIRKKSRMIGNMNCRMKIIAGEEQICTSFSMDTKERPPSWLGQIDILKVKIPITEAMKECKIHLLDVDDLVGEILMPAADLTGLEKQKEVPFAQGMFVNGQQTAAIKYSVIRGEKANFEKKDMMGSKIVARKDDKKDQPKNQDPIPPQQINKVDPSKEVKKDEQKKQDIKKEQFKKQEKKQGKNEIQKDMHSDQKKQEKKDEEKKVHQNKKDENNVKKDDKNGVKKQEQKKDLYPQTKNKQQQERKQEQKIQEQKRQEQKRQEQKHQEQKRQEQKIQEQKRQEQKRQEQKRQEQKRQEQKRQEQKRQEQKRQEQKRQEQKRQEQKKQEQQKNDHKGKGDESTNKEPNNEDNYVKHQQKPHEAEAKNNDKKHQTQVEKNDKIKTEDKNGPHLQNTQVNIQKPSNNFEVKNNDQKLTDSQNQKKENLKAEVEVQIKKQQQGQKKVDEKLNDEEKQKQNLNLSENSKTLEKHDKEQGIVNLANQIPTPNINGTGTNVVPQINNQNLPQPNLNPHPNVSTVTVQHSGHNQNKQEGQQISKEN